MFVLAETKNIAYSAEAPLQGSKKGSSIAYFSGESIFLCSPTHPVSLSSAMLRAKIVLSQSEDRDSDYFKSRFREHPVLEVRDVHPKIGPGSTQEGTSSPQSFVGRAAGHLGRRAPHSGS